jgi:hypothetical protein
MERFVVLSLALGRGPATAASAGVEDQADPDLSRQYHDLTEEGPAPLLRDVVDH